MKGASAINAAQVTFLSQVLGLRCWVYQYVSMEARITERRAVTPGRRVAEMRSDAYR